jgi:hypothetical protein
MVAAGHLIPRRDSEVRDNECPFAVFRTTAVCATVWWMFEIAEALTGRTSAKNPFINGILTLPMFGFWYLV